MAFSLVIVLKQRRAESFSGAWGCSAVRQAAPFPVFIPFRHLSRLEMFLEHCQILPVVISRGLQLQ
jgi:hypothetical protein